MEQLRVLFDAGGLWQFVPERFKTIMSERFSCNFLDQKNPGDYIRKQLAKWADVIFVDWALDWARFYLEEFPEKRIIIRTHRGDVWNIESPFYFWENADAILFMDNFWRNVFIEEGRKNILSDFEQKCITVPRLIDEIDWRFFHNKTSIRRYGKRLGMLGRLIPRKGCLEIAQLMNEKLKEFSLSMMGLVDDDITFMPGYVQKIRDQDGNISIIEHSRGDTVLNWFADIDFIISNSEDESWHAAITEGMLCGCIPLVKNWPGSDEMHPGDSIFQDSNELYEKLKSIVALSQPDRERRSCEARQWCLDRYSLEDVTDLYADIILGKEVERTVDPKNIILRRKENAS